MTVFPTRDEQDEEARLSPAGHRLLRRAADCVIESWGADRASCCAEALAALVEVFADVPDTPSAQCVPLATDSHAGADALLGLLEEVLDTVGALSVVPVRFHLADTEDGGIAGDMEVVAVEEVSIRRAPPRAISHHELSLAPDGGEWRCHVLIEL